MAQLERSWKRESNSAPAPVTIISSEFFIISAQEALTICLLVHILTAVFGAVAFGRVLIVSGSSRIIPFAVTKMFCRVFYSVAITLIIGNAGDISTVTSIATAVAVIWFVAWIITAPVVPIVWVTTVVRIRGIAAIVRITAIIWVITIIGLA